MVLLPSVLICVKFGIYQMKKKNPFICCSDFVIFSQVNLPKRHHFLRLREQNAKSTQKRQNQRGTQRPIKHLECSVFGKELKDFRR